MTQGVWAGRVLANGGRHARTERYRGRHRKPGAYIGLGTAARVGATVACVALLVCLPQSGRADGVGTTAAHLTAAGQVAASHGATSQLAVRSLPGRFRLICSTRLG